jgi:hypothetical protein
MAAAQPVAIEKRTSRDTTIPGSIEKRVKKGRINPRSDARTSGDWYELGDDIFISCYTAWKTTPVDGDL